jgi:hypothetical protein
VADDRRSPVEAPPIMEHMIDVYNNDKPEHVINLPSLSIYIQTVADFMN